MQLQDLIKSEPRVTYAYSYAGQSEWPIKKNSNKYHKWNVTLKCEGRRMRVPYFRVNPSSRPPTVTEVLTALCKEARAGELSFVDFCTRYGYKTDEAKAYAIWRACVKTTPKVKILLGSRYEKFCHGN